MPTHAKAKQGRIVPADANICLSLVCWLELMLDRIKKKNNKSKTKIVCSE
jgi:hypothetical protein